MSFRGFFEWLGATSPSIALHESLYLYLIVLTVHILTLCLFVGTAAIVDLRLLGVALRRVPASEVISRLLPWTAAGFLVMLLSGSLLLYAAPIDRYENLFFRAKMAMLVAAGVNVWVFHMTAYGRIAEWDLDPVPPRRVRVAGGVALALWASIILAGRMMPYQLYWFA